MAFRGEGIEELKCNGQERVNIVRGLTGAREGKAQWIWSDKFMLPEKTPSMKLEAGQKTSPQ